MPLFRTVFDTKSFYSERFLSARFLIRTVLIPKGRFSEIRNKNLSDQKPFGSKNFMMSKNSPKLWLLTVITPRKIINPNGFYSERFSFPIFGVKTFRNKNFSEKPFGTKNVRKKTFRRNDTSEYQPAPNSYATAWHQLFNIVDL